MLTSHHEATESPPRKINLAREYVLATSFELPAAA